MNTINSSYIHTLTFLLKFYSLNLRLYKKLYVLTQLFTHCFIQLREDQPDLKKEVVNSVLRDNIPIFVRRFKHSLKEISIEFYSSKLITGDLFDTVLEGVTGVDNFSLTSKVFMAVKDNLKVSPDRWQKFISVLKQFDSGLADVMDQKYKGKNIHIYEKLCSYLFLD